MVLAKVFMLVCVVAAIVITYFGFREIVDVPHMRAVLDMKFLPMGDVLLYLLWKYLVWSLALLFVGIGAYVTVRFVENNR